MGKTDIKIDPKSLKIWRYLRNRYLRRFDSVEVPTQPIIITKKMLPSTSGIANA